MNNDHLLFHYTSADGLLGLLGRPSCLAKLWMTQMHYMNDAAETRLAYELTATELRRLENSCPNLKRAVAGVLGIPHEGGQWRAPSGFAVARDCTFSLSEQGDLLSQWRGYAPVGAYSVGYRVRDLQAFAAAQGLRLAQCLYDEAEQRSTVESALLAMEAGFVNGESEGELGECRRMIE